MGNTGRLAGKRALVTAAAQGIGRATAIAFAREGAEVIAADINAQALAALATEGHAGLRPLPLDVTDRAAIEAFARGEAAGTQRDLLFNCAGWVPSGTILECTQHDWERAWQLNVSSMYWLCQALLPAMLAQGRGAIINMSSIASSVKGIPNRFAYTATKAAVIGLTKSIAADFVTRGIRCNAICPGTVSSPSLGQRVQAQAAAQGLPYEQVLAAFVGRQPMGRLGTPEEVAALAVYLGGDESAFTTGGVYLVDGGLVN
jgi:2-keto-3-deoxy-L-fuconate dehydrogenase